MLGLLRGWQTPFPLVQNASVTEQLHLYFPLVVQQGQLFSGFRLPDLLSVLAGDPCLAPLRGGYIPAAPFPAFAVLIPDTVCPSMPAGFLCRANSHCDGPQLQWPHGLFCANLFYSSGKSTTEKKH